MLSVVNNTLIHFILLTFGLHAEKHIYEEYLTNVEQTKFFIYIKTEYKDRKCLIEEKNKMCNALLTVKYLKTFWV